MEKRCFWRQGDLAVRILTGEASCNFLISRYPIDFITATSGISSGLAPFDRDPGVDLNS
jgi:hypothetical protein